MNTFMVLMLRITDW